MFLCKEQNICIGGSRHQLNMTKYITSSPLFDLTLLYPTLSIYLVEKNKVKKCMHIFVNVPPPQSSGQSHDQPFSACFA